MSKARILVAYYSRSGVAACVAKELALRLDADLQEIVDRRDRSGPKGFVRSIIDMLERRPARIGSVVHDLDFYEILVVATPIWFGCMAVPVRTWLLTYRKHLRRAAFLCTSGGKGTEAAFMQMGALTENPSLTARSVSVIFPSWHERAFWTYSPKRLERRLSRVEALKWMV